MKNQGFTLVELLAVLIIFGVITTIATISYNVYIDKATESYYEDIEKTMVSGAESLLTYCSSTFYEEDYCQGAGIQDIGKEFKVSLSTLVDNGFIDPVTSSKGNSCNGEVMIVNNGNNGINEDLSYKVCLECENYKSEDCK